MKPTTLATVGGRELLRWLVEHPQFSAQELEDFARAGLSDLRRLAELHDLVRDLHLEVESLLQHATTDSEGNLDDPLTFDDVPALIEVGYLAYAEDRARVPQWREVARRLDEPSIIAELVGSGRTPDEATALLDTAHQLGIPVDLYGSLDNSWLTPDRMRRLHAAGVTTATDFQDFTAARLSLDELEAIHQAATEYAMEVADLGFTGMTAARFRMLAAAGFRSVEEYSGFRAVTRSDDVAVDLRTAGVQLKVLAAAHSAGLPPDRYRELADIPAGWFARTGREHRTPLQLYPPYTFDDLLYLAHHGWRDVSRDGLFAVGPITARSLADNGWTGDDLLAWWEAFNGTPKGQEVRNRIGVEVRGRSQREVYTLLSRADEMRRLGITAADTAEYRLCGLTSPADIQAALAAGVDGKRASHLRRAYGRTLRRQGNTRRLEGLAEVLQLHQGDDPRVR